MQIREGIAAALVLVALSARPASAQASFSIDRLPSSTGRVAQYSLTPRGDVDGLILEDGTEIHLPPPLGPALIDAVKPGDTVVIHGLHARAIPMIEAVAITNQATGRTVTDMPGASAPPDRATPEPAPRPISGAPTAMSVSGTIKSQLHGPRGDLNGVLLTDGTIIRLPPADAAQRIDELQPGTALAAEGSGVAGPLGRIVAADRIGLTRETLSPVTAGPRPARPSPPQR